MRTLRLFTLCASALLVVGMMPAVTGPARAQAAADQPATASPPPPPKKKYDPYASPLEVIINNKLWTTPPPAKDFVKEARPDPKSLEYTPLVGKDPNRPKPRDKKGVEDLRAQLEQDLARNADRGKAVSAAIAAANAAPAPAKAVKPRKRKKAAGE